MEEQIDMIIASQGGKAAPITTPAGMDKLWEAEASKQRCCGPTCGHSAMTQNDPSESCHLEGEKGVSIGTITLVSLRAPSEGRGDLPGGPGVAKAGDGDVGDSRRGTPDPVSGSIMSRQHGADGVALAHEQYEDQPRTCLNPKPLGRGSELLPLEKHCGKALDEIDKDSLLPLPRPLVVDSGAAETVLPVEWCPQYAVRESQARTDGDWYTAANGDPI